MASKNDFTADEWTQLQHGLAGTVLLVTRSRERLQARLDSDALPGVGTALLVLSAPDALRHELVDQRVYGR
jgi:hypothetical protein